MWVFVMTVVTSLIALEARPILDCRTDIAFVLDGSASVGIRNWRVTLDFVRDFVHLVTYGPDKTLAAVVAFGIRNAGDWAHTASQSDTLYCLGGQHPKRGQLSVHPSCRWCPKCTQDGWVCLSIGPVVTGDLATLDITLIDSPTVEAFTEALENVTYKDEATNTAAGIKLATRQLFNTSQGARPGVAKLLILVTDGQPTVDFAQTLPQIAQSRDAGVKILSVGVGRDVGRDILLRFVDGITDLVFNTDDLGKLIVSVSEVLSGACQMVNSSAVVSGGKTTQIPGDLVTPSQKAGSILTANRTTSATGGAVVPNTERTASTAPDGAPTPAPGGASTPAPGGASTPAPGGASTPAPGGDSTPAPGGASTAASGGALSTTPGGALSPAPGGALSPAPDGPPTPVPGGASTPAPGGSLSNAPGGALSPAPGGAPTPAPGGASTPTPGGAQIPVPMTPAPGGGYTPAPGGGFTPSRTPSSAGGGTPAPVSPTPLPAGNRSTTPSSAPIFHLPCDGADLILLLDSSGSLDKEANWIYIKELAANITASLVLGPHNTQIGIVIFSSEAFLTVQLGSVTNQKELTAVIERVPWTNQMTNISGALRMARTRMFNTRNSRKGALQVLLLVTDGLSNRAINTTLWEATQLKNTGVAIFVVGLAEKVDLRELRGISSQPSRHYLTLVPAVDQLPEHVTAIFRRTCIEPAPLVVGQQPVPWTCPFHIVLLMHDTEGTLASFQLMLQVVRYITKAISLRSHRIGMVAKSYEKEIVFYPFGHLREDHFLALLDALSHLGPSTNITEVFLNAIDMLHQAKEEGVSLLKIIMVLLPTGVDPSDVKSLEDGAKKARDAGLIVYVMYKDAPRENLVMVANQPTELFLLPFSFPIVTPDICVTYKKGTLTCDFETLEGSPTLCGMNQSTTDDFNWTLKKGDTPSRHTGPEAALTGEYYIFIEASPPRKLGDTAELLLPRVSWSSPSCLSFFYHMKGWHIGMLQVVLQSPGAAEQIVWVLGGHQDERWLLGMVTVDVNGHDRLFFRAVRGGAFSGDISLDHVRLSPTPCIVSPSDYDGLVLP